MHVSNPEPLTGSITIEIQGHGEINSGRRRLSFVYTNSDVIFESISWRDAIDAEIRISLLVWSLFIKDFDFKQEESPQIDVTAVMRCDTVVISVDPLLVDRLVNSVVKAVRNDLRALKLQGIPIDKVVRTETSESRDSLSCV